MSLNSTPSAQRLHISFFGLTNAGKSSLVNAVTNQEMSVVSNTHGTTTDPVKKSMELLPLGPVVIVDTPGFNDKGELGEKRVKKTREILSKTDIAVLVTDATRGLEDGEEELLKIFLQKQIPFVIAKNKSDLLETEYIEKENEVLTCATKLLGIEKQTVIADYFVLACGANNTQVSALADELEFKLSENGINADRREGHGASEWIVIDYNSVIVHVFSRDARAKYNLEKLWADADDIDITNLLS